MCFTRAAIIIAARLMAGGLMVTGLPAGIKEHDLGLAPKDLEREHTKFNQ